MNFLAHLYLADLTNDSPAGHLLGDFVKGSCLRGYDGPIRSAILFHRRIDSFCDAHPVTRTSRNRVGPARRRFAGILVDISYDHFLACHWHCFASEPLADFAQRIYAALERERLRSPLDFGTMLSRMIAHDWLTAYLHIDKVSLALDRIAERLTRGERFKGAIQDLIDNYQGLQSDFQNFFPELIRFATEFSARG